MTPGFDHLVVEVVALAGALADAREHREAAVRLGDVVDQLHDDHGLADARPAEQPDLAALGIGRQQVDDLDAGGQDLGLGRLVDQQRRRLVDRHPDLGVDRARARRPARRSRSGSGPASRARPASRSARRCRSPPGRGSGRRCRPSRSCARSNSPRCCATSRTSLLPWLSVCRAFRIAGSAPSNWTSTTAPITCVTRPAWTFSRLTSFILVPRLRQSPVRLGQSASAPETISISSRVICAWRVRL